MIYFASDIHLGSGGKDESRRVEGLFLKWLDRVAEDAEAIFLCGDIFDFWFEYRRVVPKGHVRVLAKIAELTERGVRVVFMAGNHDMWVGDYLSEECGVEIYTKPERFTLGDTVVHVAHGDNLNVGGDWVLKLMNNTFRSKIVRSLFSSLVHPDLALKFGQWWSASSRNKHKSDGAYNRGLDALKEYAAQQQLISPCDHYIYGHLHLTLQYKSDNGAYQVTFMSDWSHEPTFATLDHEGQMKIERI